MSVTIREAKPGDVRTAHYIPTIGPIEGAMESYRPWTPPKLGEKGKEFKPKRHAAGDVIVFEVDGVRRRGPVWSEGPERGSLWVVIDQIAYLVRGVR